MGSGDYTEQFHHRTMQNTGLHRGALGLWMLAVASSAFGQPAEANDIARCSTGWDIGDARVSVGGQHRLMVDGSNFTFHEDRVGTAPASVAAQRSRTWFNLHDRESCRFGVYIQAEVGHLFLGDELESAKTARVELRRGHFWFKPTSYSLLRAGVIGWEDRFGQRPTFGDSLWAIDRSDASRAPLANSAWGFQVGGVTFEASVADGWHYRVGTLVLQRADRTIVGNGSSLLFTGDVDREVGSGLIGLSSYYLRDRGNYSYGRFGGPGPSDGNWDLWLGGRAHLATGRAESALFLIWNRGDISDAGWSHLGWAAKWAMDIPFERGTLRWQTLYSTGDDGSDPSRSGEFRTIAQSVRDNLGAQSYWSLVGITSPRGPSDLTDLGVGLQNDGHGLFTMQAGWEHPLSASWSLYGAGAWLRADEPNPVSGASNMGTELLGEARWKMASILALDFGGSWLFTGDFFRTGPAGAKPASLYQLYARWQLEF
jgi:hypothetical protein